MNICLGNLPRSASEDQIRELLAQHGEVTSVKIIFDRMTNQPRGFAFIEMPSEDEAKKFIETCNGFMFEGRRLVVSEARKREENGGGSRGGDFRSGPRRPSFGDRNDRGGDRGGRPFRGSGDRGGFNRFE